MIHLRQYDPAIARKMESALAPMMLKDAKKCPRFSTEAKDGRPRSAHDAHPARVFILSTLDEIEEVSRPDLARGFGCRPEAMGWHLMHLERDGLIEGERRGKTTYWRLTEEAMQ